MEPHDGDRPKQIHTISGAEWSVQGRNEHGTFEPLVGKGIFDELFVDHWLHIEWMDDAEWFCRIGDARIMASVATDGSVTVDVQRGFFDDIRGTTEEFKLK